MEKSIIKFYKQYRISNDDIMIDYTKVVNGYIKNGVIILPHYKIVYNSKNLNLQFICLSKFYTQTKLELITEKEFQQVYIQALMEQK